MLSERSIEMANPLFNGPMQFGPFGNIQNTIQQFNQFQSTFQGNPQQKVQELLQTGQMSQQQFNQLSQMAQVFRQILGR